MITSILGGLNGRKVELAEYMKKIRKPDNIRRTITWVFEELRSEKINQKLLELVKDNEDNIEKKYKTLFDFVNSESVDKLLEDATSSYQQLEV